MVFTQVLQNRPVPLTLRELTREENTAYYEHKAELERTAPPEPSYGFIGRDLDVLRIEKHLLTRPNQNMLLVRGMGGAGKTTLVRHLSAWWRTTGLVERVFYFGYDERAWNRQQILIAIPQQFLDPVVYLRDFQPLSLDAQQSKLAPMLRAHRHLLIVDNLESITGTNLAILHTLDTHEQEALRTFLAALVGGRTLVLLGSRSGETWLAKGTFDNNVYTLPGLDPEAASTLADLILEHYTVTHYRTDKDVQHLLKLLDGFPLALEVVFPNLAHQTPQEVLTALQAGDVDLDTDNPEDKTRSILQCIDYSHSNLSPEAQQLLLCLTPFTSVFWLDVLDNYTKHLKQQPVLSVLAFERWPEVLQEAVNWGLLSPDSDNPRFLRLQPTLSYFLHTRLNRLEQGENKAAIEKAFCEHYREVGGSLHGLLTSKAPQERQIGQIIAHLEYENLVTAINVALAAQETIAGLYEALMEYLDSTKNQRQALKLFQTIEKQFARYSSEKLAGSLDAEYIRVIGTVANQQLALKQFEQAKASYQKVLEHVELLERVDEQGKGRLKATTYHQLGVVAQEQRKWEEAERYYQQALQIYVEYQDRDAQADTYHQLGRVAQEQLKWEEAERYYQQALQIKIEYRDRYEQARTYAQLGVLAWEQQQWEQVRNYLLQALEIFASYDNDYNAGITLHNLARLWQKSEDASLPGTIATLLGTSVSDAENWLRKTLAEDDGGQREE